MFCSFAHDRHTSSSTNTTVTFFFVSSLESTVGAVARERHTAVTHNDVVAPHSVSCDCCDCDCDCCCCLFFASRALSLSLAETTVAAVAKETVLAGRVSAASAAVGVSVRDAASLPLYDTLALAETGVSRSSAGVSRVSCVSRVMWEGVKADVSPDEKVKRFVSSPPLLLLLLLLMMTESWKDETVERVAVSGGC